MRAALAAEDDKQESGQPPTRKPVSFSYSPSEPAWATFSWRRLRSARPKALRRASKALQTGRSPNSFGNVEDQQWSRGTRSGNCSGFNRPASQAQVITPVFASGDGAFLGIERPTVPVGDGSFPVLSTLPSVKGPFSDSTEAAQTDATFVANSLAPERLQASFSYTRTDAARFAGLDSSLRLALNGGLQEKLDQQAIEGTDGLLTGTNLPNANVSATSTFALYLSGLLYGRIDGRYARTPGDVKMILGQGTFAHASSTYKGNNSDESGVERLQEKSGGMMVSAHVPAVSGNKQNALIRLGQERGAAIQPLWQGVSLVVDEFTRAAFGEVIIPCNPARQLRRHP